MSLVTELRRRQVFRAAAWYAAAAWVAIQVASTVIPQFGLPDWLVRAVIVAAVLGLPIALALAWSFDLSAMGLRREAEAPPPAAPREAVAAAPAPLWRVPSFWIALTLGAGLGGVFLAQSAGLVAFGAIIAAAIGNGAWGGKLALTPAVVRRA